MVKRTFQHTGDDQLVYGLPKHMVGSSTNESLKKSKTRKENDNSTTPENVVF